MINLNCSPQRILRGFSLRYWIYNRIQVLVSYPRVWRNRKKLKIFFKSLPVRNSIYFDVGANFGEKTAFYNKLGKKVVAIEPQKECLRILRSRFANNPDINIVPYGLGEIKGTHYLYISSRYRGFSSLNKDWQKNTKYGNFDQKEQIKITTLESLIKKFGVPDFCKIDVEGSELRVLKGLKTKIPCLNFEFHGNRLKEAESCLDVLNNFGFKEFNYGESENSPFLEAWVSKKVLFKLLKKRSKVVKKLWGDIYAK